MKFRKKPVVIEAIQFTGYNEHEFNDYSLECFNNFGNYFEYGRDTGTLAIKTLEGTMIASKGDWIIKGVNGEFYPCKPDIFEKTYEIVE